MRYIVADIETTEIDGKLLKDIEAIHCIALKPEGGVTKCYTSKPIATSDGTLQEALEILNKADTVIGHNFIKFDRPVIHYLLGNLKPPIIDTLIDAKLTIPKDVLLTNDMKKPYIPKDLKGSYSLKAFGYRMQFFKMDYSDFSELNEEMIKYCKQDVEVTEKLYQYLIQYKYYPSKEVRELEYEIARIIQLQEEYGCYFDYDKAMEYSTKLQFEIMNIDNQLKKIFPQRFVADGDVVEPKATDKRRKEIYPSKLDIHRNIKYQGDQLQIGKNGKWVFSKKVVWRDYPFNLVFIKPTGQYQKIKLETFNPGSRQQIISRLYDTYKWKPRFFTEKGNPKFSKETIQDILKEDEYE